eukprot:CAMPEP_0116899746 /NCGR_PEP_ID=MMETSP0467-20121206/8243_1 /TAXON_ID=283647 /ORGANISM="Mesodinium pulex, Strain SPMC105" /LENGTH=49 /DNA_ID=CAMNT_0004572731 /DNA_START=176 /DNA_END=325 /DNA_ORIENTATION=+
MARFKNKKVNVKSIAEIKLQEDKSAQDKERDRKDSKPNRNDSKADYLYN